MTCTLTLLFPTNRVSKLKEPQEKMKNMNTDTGKYTHNREATNGSAEIKLPGRQKEVSDIDRENIFRSNIC